MSLIDTFFATTVLKYKVEAKEAVKDIQNLSKEQQKAAKESAKALEEQGKSAETTAAKYAKGAAVIAGAYVLIKSGVEAHAKESRLAAGSVGVDLDKLDKAAGGLKTRWELMTLAQAGSQGAWKLSTSQIALVVEGMRALEKKGFDATEVTDQLTESLKKGKLEGLDKFGLSAKDLGNKTANLQSLMRQLGRATDDVGGKFDKAGDKATRAGVKFANARDKAGSSIGRGVDAAIGGIEAGAEGVAWLFADDIRETMGDAGVYDLKYQEAKIARAQRIAGDEIARAQRIAADEAARDSAEALAASIEENDAAAKEVFDAYDASVVLRKQQANDAIARRKSMTESNEILMSLGLGPASTLIPGAWTAEKEYARIEREDAYEALRDKAGEGDAGGVEREQWEKVQGSKELVKRQVEMDKADAAEKDSWLASMFGPVEDFDIYTSALTALGSTTQDVAGQMYDAWTSGAELSGKMIRKMIGAEIAAEGKKLLVRGISGMLTGAYHTVTGDPRGPLEVAAGAAMVAGSVAIGAIAREVGGSGGGGGASGGARGASQDHRGSGGGSSGGGGGPGNHTTVMVGDGWADDSPRYRARTVSRAITSAARYAPPRGIEHG